ncbi:hypothetical protein ACHAXR_010449 [Thalassiosira sp. AJA248-18]
MAADSLRQFCGNIGIPVNLKSDLAPSFTGPNTEFQKVMRKNGINMTFAEAGQSNQVQQVDVAIRKLNGHWHHKMVSRNVPCWLWCFGITHHAKLMWFIPRGRDGRSGYEQITGQNPDISEFCDFDFYDLVWYWPHSHPYTAERSKELAQWVGVAHRIGSDMSYWLIPVSGTPIADTTVQHRLKERLNDDNFHLPANDCDFYLNDLYDDTAYKDESNTPTDEEYEMPEERPEADDVELYDKFIGSTFLLDSHKKYVNVGTRATVVKQATGHQGNPVGRARENMK